MKYDLAAEMLAAVSRVEQSHLNSMIGMGVSASAVANLGHTQEPFGIGKVEFLGANYWQPHDGPASIGAIVQPVYEDGDIIDLIAWRSLKPSDWRWRVGNAWALGADFIHGTAWRGFSSLTVHPTPLSWLASAGEGLTVLDWESTLVRQLALFDEIVCDDSKVAGRLNEILSRPARVPRIVKRALRHVA